MRAKLLAMIIAAAIGVPAAGVLVTSNATPGTDITTTSTTAATAAAVTQPTIDEDLVTACTKDGPSDHCHRTVGTRRAPSDL